MASANNSRSNKFRVAKSIKVAEDLAQYLALVFTCKRGHKHFHLIYDSVRVVVTLPN